MSMPIASPPGWYFCRVDRDGQLQRFPIAAWVVGEQGAYPLVTKPGHFGLTRPDAEDVAAAVGCCPPDRDAPLYFATEDVRMAVESLYRYDRGRRGDRPSPGDGDRMGEVDGPRRATVGEVDVPGHGPVPVRDAAPPGQRTAPWRGAWDNSRQRLPEGRN